MRNKDDDHSPRAGQVAMVAGLLKSVMVALYLHKAMANNHMGVTDNPFQAKGNMDSPILAKDNMDSHKADMAAPGSSSQVATEDRHQISPLMVVNRVVMVLLRPHRDTRRRW
jgi:hypothetical protein